ncbi:MAG: hypothetical protein ACX94C_10410 [Phycisphaerales bacterium]
MQEWRSASGAIAVGLWMLMLMSGAFGCGFTREVTLPNGYICNVDKFIWIDHPGILGDVVHDVEELDVNDEIVFGTRRDYWNGQFIGYFVLDTQLQAVWFTSDYDEWVQQLADLGITDRNLRWPGVNFNGSSVWQIVVPILIFCSVISVILWIILQFAKHERAIRQDRLDRL